MRATAMFLMVLAAGCGAGGGAQGEKGPAGDKGATGDQGPRGESGYSGFVWVDATGAFVGPYAERPLYADDAGVLWELNKETAEVSPVTILVAASVFYVTDDCSGEEWFTGLPSPGIAVEVLTAKPSVPHFVVRNSGTTLREATLKSYFVHLDWPDGGTTDMCGLPDMPVTQSGLPMSDMTAVSKPALQFVPPLELRLR